MTKEKTIVVIVFIAAVVLVAGLLFLHSSDAPAGSLASLNEGGVTVLDLVLTDNDGNQVRLYDLRGTPLVINSWASWCTFCRDELPDFAAAQNEFGDTVRFIAINRQEDVAIARSYTDDLGVSSDMLFLLDSADSFYQQIGGFAMPETIFVDANGAIVEHKRGVMNLEEIKMRTQRLLDVSRSDS